VLQLSIRQLLDACELLASDTADWQDHPTTSLQLIDELQDKGMLIKQIA